MTKRPTIKELCRGRLLALPSVDEAPREARIAIMCANLAVMRVEMGRIPTVYPQSEADVPDWIDQHDQTKDRLSRAIKAVSGLPEGTLLPSPFLS